MANATYTTPLGGTEPSSFTVSGFQSLTASLQDVLDRAAHLEAVALDEGVDIMGLQDETVSAWHRAEAATAAFLRANRGSERAAPLVRVAERIDRMLCLTGLEDRGDLFGLIASTMQEASDFASGDRVGRLVTDVVPRMFGIGVLQSVFLPEDADAAEPIAA